MTAWRNPIGPASSRTVRSPRATLPTVRPRNQVSNVMGIPIRAPISAIVTSA